MAIRPVRGVADIRRCAPILVAAFNESPFTTRWTTKSAIDRLSEVYKDGKEYCFVDERKDGVVGFIFCSTKEWDQGTHLTVQHLIVHEASRSKGIGSKLLERSEREAKKRGIRAIDLTTNVSGPGAEFWRKREFRPTGYIQMSKTL